MNKTMFIPDKAHKQNLPPHQHSVRTHLKYFAHRIHSSRLWSSGKRPVQKSQSAACSSSSSKGTVMSVYESDRVSDRDGSRQTLLFSLFEGSRRAFDSKPIGFGFSGLFDFLFLTCHNKISVR